jgi:hypothetical protein
VRLVLDHQDTERQLVFHNWHYPLFEGRVPLQLYYNLRTDCNIRGIRNALVVEFRTRRSCAGRRNPGAGASEDLFGGAHVTAAAQCANHSRGIQRLEALSQAKDVGSDQALGFILFDIIGQRFGSQLAAAHELSGPAHQRFKDALLAHGQNDRGPRTALLHYRSLLAV